MAYEYSNPKRANDPHALPDVETFEARYRDCHNCGEQVNVSYSSSFHAQQCKCGAFNVLRYTDPVGWFYQFCFPGCLPDGDPMGPFATEAEALADAREQASDGMDDGDDVDDESDNDVTDDEESDNDEPGEEDYFLSDDERSIYYLGKPIVQASDDEIDGAPCPRDAVMRKLAAVRYEVREIVDHDSQCGVKCPHVYPPPSQRVFSRHRSIESARKSLAKITAHAAIIEVSDGGSSVIFDNKRGEE